METGRRERALVAYQAVLSLSSLSKKFLFVDTFQLPKLAKTEYLSSKPARISHKMRVGLSDLRRSLST